MSALKDSSTASRSSRFACAGASGEQLVNVDLEARLRAVAAGALGARAAVLGESVAEARLALAGYQNETLVFDELVGQLAGEGVAG